MAQFSLRGEPELIKKQITMNEYDAFDDYECCDGSSEWDADRETFDALTDGQYGSYDDFAANGGDLDWLTDALGF